MEEQLNDFLQSHYIVSVVREFSVLSGGAYWFFCVEYRDSPVPASGGSGRQNNKHKDYKEILSEEEFAIYAQLRNVRYEISQKEAVPVYTICTNEQLAIIARDRPATLAELKKIPGLGEAKVEKYGPILLAALPQQAANEQESDS